MNNDQQLFFSQHLIFGRFHLSFHFNSFQVFFFISTRLNKIGLSCIDAVSNKNGQYLRSSSGAVPNSISAQEVESETLDGFQIRRLSWDYFVFYQVEQYFWLTLKLGGNIRYTCQTFISFSHSVSKMLLNDFYICLISYF